MDLIRYEVAATAELAAARVANLIADHLRVTTRPRLGLATGATPLPVYRELVRMTRAAQLDWSHVETFNLDEYVGLTAEDPRSYHAYMRAHLFDAVGLSRERTHLPSGSAPDPEQEAVRYEALIANRGGITLQLLGIGRNGHVGFNEPGSPAECRTRVVDLTESTIAANSRYFDAPDDVPRQAITMGVGTIRDAATIVLLATGVAKSTAVATAIQTPCTITNPASLLQAHPSVHFVLDPEAASELIES